MGRHLFPLKRTRKPGHPPCRGEPVHFPPNVRVVGGPVSHGWATFARRVHESGAGASRVNGLLAFACCSGAVWGGGRWASAAALDLSSSHTSTYGRRPFTARNTDRGAHNFGQLGSAAHSSCPVHARGCAAHSPYLSPRARFVFKNINGSFRCDLPFSTGETSFSVEKNATSS